MLCAFCGRKDAFCDDEDAFCDDEDAFCVFRSRKRRVLKYFTQESAKAAGDRRK